VNENVIHENVHTKRNVFTAPGAHMHTPWEEGTERWRSTDGWLIDRKKGRDRERDWGSQRAWREGGVDKERTETGGMHSPH